VEINGCSRDYIGKSPPQGSAYYIGAYEDLVEVKLAPNSLEQPTVTMKVSQLIRGCARTLPFPFRVFLGLCRKGYLPSYLYDHWLSQAIENDLYAKSDWVGRLVYLTDGIRIEVDPRDYLGKRIIKYGCYEPETVDFIQKFIKPGMTVLDIGANVGYYSLLASRLVGSAGSVHSFEPHPLMYRVLNHNLRRNRCWNVVANNSAISNEKGEAQLFLSTPSNFGSTSLTPAWNYSGQPVSVQRITLDSYVRSKAVRQIDLIKIDVEGAEIQALQGATAALSEHPNLLLVVEFCEGVANRFGHSTADLATFLRDHGFHLFRLETGKLEAYQPRTDEPSFFNIVASRAAKLC